MVMLDVSAFILGYGHTVRSFHSPKPNIRVFKTFNLMLLALSKYSKMENIYIILISVLTNIEVSSANPRSFVCLQGKSNDFICVVCFIAWYNGYCAKTYTIIDNGHP